MITSVNKLSAELKAIQEAHYQLNSYYFGDFNLALQNRELNYPLMCCDYNNANLNISNTTIQMFVIIADKVYKDNVNLIETKSDTLQICRDIFNVIKKSNRWQKIGRITSSSVTSFVERGKDELAGHVLNFSIELRDANGICELPLNGYNFETEINNVYCEPSLVVNSNSTYVQQINSGESLVLPNMTVEVQINGNFKEYVNLITLDS